MVVGALLMTLHLPASHSLKDKRQVVRSLTERVRHRFAVSVSEVDALDQWQRCVIGLACVSNDVAHVDSVIARAVDFLASGHEGAILLEYHTETIHAF